MSVVFKVLDLDKIFGDSRQVVMSSGKVPEGDRIWYIAGAIVDQLRKRFGNYGEVARILEAAVEEAHDKNSRVNEAKKPRKGCADDAAWRQGEHHYG